MAPPPRVFAQGPLWAQITSRPNHRQAEPAFSLVLALSKNDSFCFVIRVTWRAMCQYFFIRRSTRLDDFYFSQKKKKKWKIE